MASDGPPVHPDLLAIGHVARDRSRGRHSLGGAVTFGALSAYRLGLSPAIVTSAGPELDLEAAGSTLLGIPLHSVPAGVTTTFQNTYSQGRRTQTLQGVAGPITPADVPREWRSTPLVFLCPLAGELSSEMAGYFPDSVVVASLQGWLRQWDATGLVRPKYWEGRDVLPHVDAAVVSEEDVEHPSLIDLWAELAPVLILTLGVKGARLHHRERWHDIAPFPAREVDSTGAGDVFGAAYLVRYRETGEPLESARFASCAASFSVEAEGTDGVPTREQVEQRLRANPVHGVASP